MLKYINLQQARKLITEKAFEVRRVNSKIIAEFGRNEISVRSPTKSDQSSDAGCSGLYCCN